MLRFVLVVTAAALAPLAAAAQGIVTVESAHDVDDTAAALVAAAEGAGATVFADVDHGGGAAAVGMVLDDARLVIFGNPRLGTPALQDDIRAGLVLPLRVLVYEGADGVTRLAYQDPAAMFAGLDIADDAPYVAAMRGALGKLTGAAAGQ